MPVYRLILPSDAPPSVSPPPADSFPRAEEPPRADSPPATDRSISTPVPAQRLPEYQGRTRSAIPAPVRPEIRATGLTPEGTPALAPLPVLLVPGPRPTPVALQPQKPEASRPAPPAAYVEPLEVPGPERLFRLESEHQLRERIRQEQRDRASRAVFPTDVPTAPDGVTYQGRAWPRMISSIPASITSYQPLYFEDKNVERYGWDAGIFQPFLSAGKFYLDLALLPYNLGAQPPWSLEYNAGYALPGDPEPYRLYLPRCSVTGASLESLAVLGIIALP